MDRKTVVKRIEEAIQASDDNTVELRVGIKAHRVRYDESRKEYSLEEEWDKGYVGEWVTHASGDSVNDDDIISWMRACIGQFKEPIWDTLLPDPKKASVK